MKAQKRKGAFEREKMFYGILPRNLIYTENTSIFPKFEICIKTFMKNVPRWLTHNYEGVIDSLTIN